jgi:hypothetical protein
MTSMILSVESKRSGMLPSLFKNLSGRHTPPLFQNYRYGATTQLRARQSLFISMLLGERIVYTGKDIYAAPCVRESKG